MALEVLREVRDAIPGHTHDAEPKPFSMKAVQLALRVLRRHVDDLWLRQYWDAISNRTPSWQNLNASMNGIERNLAGRRSGPKP